MAYNTQDFEVNLLQMYDEKDLYEPCEREETRWWDDMKESADHKPNGKGRAFRIIGNSGHSVGNPAEGGAWSRHNPRRQSEGTIQSVRTDSVVEFTMTYLEAGKDGGSYGQDPEVEGVLEATRNLFSYQDVLMGVGHGTGRMAIVEGDHVGVDVITLALPEGGFQLRPGYRIDFVDLDTGGTVMVHDVEILEVVPNGATPQIVLDDDVTVLDGWGIYMRDVYGNPMPEGARSIIDDGDFATEIFGLVRADVPYANAVVDDNNQGLRDYTPEAIRNLLGRIRLQQDQTPTQIRMNEGMVNAHLARLTPDTIYSVTSDAVPKYPSGANQEGLSFTYAEKKIPIRVDRNMPAREVWAIYKPGWRKHTLRKAAWVPGPNGKFFHIKPDVDTLTYTVIGTQLLEMNQSCKRLNANGKASFFRDNFGAGDE